jgi:small subunit ribosomal protein S16
MLSIRFRPIGKKHQRSFRLVVDEKRHRLQGKNVEDLGWYDPHAENFDIKNKRVVYWIKNGAKPTDTVHNLLVKAQVIKGKKIAVHSKSKKKKETDPADKGSVVASAGEVVVADKTPKDEVKSKTEEVSNDVSKEEVKPVDDAPQVSPEDPKETLEEKPNETAPVVEKSDEKEEFESVADVSESESEEKASATDEPEKTAS